MITNKVFEYHFSFLTLSKKLPKHLSVYATELTYGSCLLLNERNVYQENRTENENLK